MGINNITDEMSFVEYARSLSCLVTIEKNKIIVTYTDHTQIELERGKDSKYYREMAKLLY